MLQSLHVHNFALIEDAKVDFTQGFNVFTGETGAGKSILIDAFGMVLGNRASSDYIRNGTDSFWVQAIFDISAMPKVKELLQVEGIDVEDELFLKRQVMANGKSQNTINGVQVPLAVLKSFAGYLVDIHGQHENQALLKIDSAITILDAFGGVPAKEALENYSVSYSQYLTALEKVEQLKGLDGDREYLLEKLNWEIKEITEANIVDDEEEALREEDKRIQNSEKILQSISAAYQGLDAERGSLEVLGNVKTNVANATRYDERLQVTLEGLESAWTILEDARHELSGYLEDNLYDEERVAEVRSRLDVYYKIHKKYGSTIEDVNEHLAAAILRCSELQDLEESLIKAEKDLSEKEAEMDVQGKKLTVIRTDNSKVLAEKIVEHMKDLAMPEGRFEIEVKQKERYGSTGIDEVQFLFSANLGEALLPLAKVASGGELSRVALALKTVLMDKYSIGTMVFDEIDTGVGGITAQKMAEKIAILSNKGQVLCITHLPQIAAFANQHIYIKKESDGERTKTNLEILSDKDRVSEIMRMTVGENISALAEANAKEQLDIASKIKKELKNK